MCIYFILLITSPSLFFFFFFFNDTATTEIYTLSLHDALPIWRSTSLRGWRSSIAWLLTLVITSWTLDRKSTRLNSSHDQISYAVFCLKKKKKNAKLDARCVMQMTNAGNAGILFSDHA